MGVSLDSKDLIAGYPPTTFKNALLGYARTRSPGNLIDLKSVFPLRRAGAIVFEECLDRGLIDPETLQLTPAGETLVRAKAQKRTPIEKADAVLRQFLDNADAMNADEDAISQVDKVWLFGSMMRREATVGDIDLAVSSSRKPRFSDHRAREQHARRRVAAFVDAPSSWQFPWERDDWLERRALYGSRRHPLLAGVQRGTSDLASLGVPCRLIYDRSRGGRVADPILDKHPKSTGRDPSLDPPATIPDLTPAAIRPMDGRWVAGYSTWGVVSPYDIFRGWTDDAHRLFANYPEDLRVLADGFDLRSFPWQPKRLRQPGLDGRAALLVMDATEWWGVSLVLNRAIETSDRQWILHARFSNVELNRARTRVDLASTPAIVGAVSLVLAVDAERMLRRAREQSDAPRIEIQIAGDGLIDEIRVHVVDEIAKALRSRSVRIEPEGWAQTVAINSASL